LKYEFILAKGKAMTIITSRGKVLKKRPKSCKGIGCPMKDCDFKDVKSEFECLGEYDTYNPFGEEKKIWICEFYKTPKIVKNCK